MYTMYSLPGTCSTGIVILLEKLGVNYDLKNRDDISDYKDIVPTNQVPALKTKEGQIITEGAAIGLYLLEKHGQDNGLDLMPSTPEDKAEFYRWLMFNYATLHPAYSKIFATRGALEGKDVQKETMQKMADGVSNMWKILDKRLATRDYVVGDQPTLIDYLLVVYARWEDLFPELEFSYGENVQKHVSKIAELPEVKSAFKREGIELKSAA